MEPEQKDAKEADARADAASPAGPAPVRRDLTGSTLLAYEVHNVVGVGGMGTVYRAIDTRSNREVAMKVLDPNHDPAKTPILRERFQREARLSMRLSHRNIVEVLDAGEHDGVSFIVMELLKGQTLFQILERERVLPVGRALAVFRDMCAGLSFAHELGLVHRDLKPANVMVMRTGLGAEEVKLLDFGLAKPFVVSPSSDDDVTRQNLVMGSPTYMAPEQARGESGVEGDIYSMGVVLFRMLTGRVPFSGRSGIDVIVQHVQAPVPQFADVAPEARVSEALELVVRRCLEKQPKHRYPSVKSLLAALVEAENSPSTPMPRKSKPQLIIVEELPEQPGKVPTPVAVAKAVSRETARVPTPRSMTTTLPPATAAGSEEHPMPSLFSASHTEPGRFGFAWVVLAFIAVGVVAWLLGRSSREETAAQPSALAAKMPFVPEHAAGSAKPAAPVTPAVETPKAPAASVTFRINSIPTGALVKSSGKTMGRTPVVFDVPADENGEATAELTLELRGYQALTFIATSSGPRFDLVQRLRKGSGRVTIAPLKREVVAAPPVSEPVATVTVPEPAPQAAEAPAVSPAPAVVVPAPAPVAAASNGVVPLEQVSLRPKMINPGQPPRYTPDAVAAKIEGTSVARCRVTVTGSLADCHITKSVPMLDQAVIDSLGTRKYEPAKLGANVVETEISVVTRLTAQR